MMPIIESQAQRDALIADCKTDIEITKRYIHLYGETPGLNSKLLRQKITLAALEAMCCLPTDEELKMLREGDFCAEELWGVSGVKSCPKCHNKKFPPVPVLKPVVCPNLPDDCDRTEAHFKYQKAIREAGYTIQEGK